jgi:hypothetical protein
VFVRQSLSVVVGAFACGALAATLAPAQPAPIAILTVLDGSGLILRGVSRYTLAEGVRLQQGDIIETPDRSLAQFELPDGTAVSVGGPSRSMIVAAPGRPSSPAEVFLLIGTLKATVPGGSTLRVTTPTLSAVIARSTGVLASGADGASLFAETGEIRVEAAGTPATVKGGQYCDFRTGQRLAIAASPAQAFVAALPRPFLDALPSRRDLFRQREAPLRNPQAFSYADVEPWLDSTPAIRRILVARWRSKAAEPAFRQGLLANLKAHPEWYGVLFPEKERVAR